MSTMPPEPTDGRGPWKEFLCRACGLIYHEGEGDLDSGIAPGTRFEDIPEDWSCPICGVRKQDFEPYDRAVAASLPSAPVVRRTQGGVVIVGAGLAGWSVAEAIRARDADIAITIVTSCAGDLYHKPELAVALSRKMTPDGLRRETGADAARRLGVRLMTQTNAVGISVRGRRLRTTRGTLAYDSLILAFGARPTPPRKLDPALCWRINDLQAWSALSGTLSGNTRRLAIVGAGMVGCELAEDLARAGHAVNLVSLTAEPLEGLFPTKAGERVRQGLEGLGVRFYGSVSATSMEVCEDGIKVLRLSDGNMLAVDQIITATGLSTPTRMVKAAGIAFDNGIAVDPQMMQTSAENVFALGDCVSIGGMPCRFVEPISAQAATIAASVTGGKAVYYEHRSPVIRLKTRSAPVVVEGSIRRGGEWRHVEGAQGELIMEQWLDGNVTARLVA
jgi:rubredoxin---NAD+ reductase